jgi:transcriptional regulator with XRE-family HTH domain
MTVQRVTPTATAMLSHEALSARIRLIFASCTSVHSILLGISASSSKNVARTAVLLVQLESTVNYNNISGQMNHRYPPAAQPLEISAKAQKILDQLVVLSYANIMSNPTEMGIRIRDVRRERGWTQDQLANAVGVSRSAVAQWETGRAGQVTSNLTRIAEVLEVGVEFLMYGDDKRAPAEARVGDEIALLRLYRECSAEDRQLLLRTARRLVTISRREAEIAGN